MGSVTLLLLKLHISIHITSNGLGVQAQTDRYGIVD